MGSAQQVKEQTLLDGGTKTLTILSKLANLKAARNFASEAALTCGFSDAEVYEIKLAAGEAVANAIEHGSPNGEGNSVELTCYCKDGSFLIIVKDEGCFKKRVLISNDGASYRGRGIPLMLVFMDKVAIDERSNGTRVTLSKRLPDAK
ncbi:MAG: ATP-binding protein [Actinobacteria bacterium]|nr:ATP-binding protein [Actinomycetota bacterium]